METILKKYWHHHRLSQLRKSLSIPSIDNNDFVFQLATSTADLEAAYALLHDSYTKEGYMKASTSGLRLTIFHAMPYAVVLVSKYKGKVVATVTLIKDGPMGLPSDHDYLEENKKFRSQSYLLCEVSSLAIDPEFRSGLITFHLIKYLWHYATDILDVTMFCCVINPKALDFYEAYLSFEKSGPTIDYDFVEGAKGVYITRDLQVHKNWLKKMFADAPKESNLFDFFYEPTRSFIFPEKSGLSLVRPVFTPKMLNYFFTEKSDTLKNADPDQLNLLESVYSLFFDVDDFLKRTTDASIEKDNRLQFRYPSAVEAVLIGNQVSIIGKITDIGTHGFFFQTSKNFKNTNQKLQIIFKLDDGILITDVELRWKSGGSNKFPLSGFGFRFLEPPEKLRSSLKKLHFNQKETL